MKKANLKALKVKSFTTTNLKGGGTVKDTQIGTCAPTFGYTCDCTLYQGTYCCVQTL